MAKNGLGKIKIPVCWPSTTQKETKWVLKALKENKISSTAGFVELFEKEFAKKIGTRYCVAVNSGYSALFLALRALGIGKGDEVIVPDFTMIATANAVSAVGAIPVFVDARWDTCNINTDLIEEKITPRTKAIIPVHLYGHPCEMDEILEIARRYNLFVIEDAAEAHGAEYKGKMVGSLGDVSCFSFYANKIITTGEGGAIATNNKKLAEDLRRLRAYYFTPGTHFWHKKMAWNFRMSSIEAAYGLGQLERWNELIEKRRENAMYYSERLEGVGDLELPVEKENVKNVYWMYLIKTRERDRLMEFLEKKGIETRTGFFPMHWQPIYKQKGDFPVADKLGKQTMYLPSAPDLSKKQMDYIIKYVREFFKEKNLNNWSWRNWECSGTSVGRNLLYMD